MLSSFNHSLCKFSVLDMNSLSEVQEKADGILVTAIICIVLSGIAVGLRIFTKTIVKTCYGADDWAIITALLLFYIVEGLQMHGEQKKSRMRL